MGSSVGAQWNDGLADFYAHTMAESGYADAVVPLMGAPFTEVLDIGAGSGELTRRALADRAVWRAVEPNAAMQRHLMGHAPSLAERGIEVILHPQAWQHLPHTLTAATVLAANLGATHHQAAEFFDAMQPRAQRNMIWVVAAQNGPSTFCAAGFLPPELHRADMTPAVDRCVMDLGRHRQPHSIEYADWEYRVEFSDVAQAQHYFLQRLALDQQGSLGQALQRFVADHVKTSSLGVVASCRKRSAVMRWQFDSR
jgi:hypothetical protein